MGSKPRVLVTGARGHIGSACVEHLESLGFEVVGLSRRGPFVADISSREFLSNARERIEPCEAIVHCAALISKHPFDPEIAETNCTGTQNIFALAESWQVRNVVYTSSIMVIGAPKEIPVTESHPLNPPTSYHASKLFGEQIMRHLSMPSCALRISSPVGKGTPAGRIFSTFVDRAIKGKSLQLAGKGSRKQDFIDVGDLGKAIAACVLKKPQGIFNLASGCSTSNLELATRCINVLNSASTIEFTGAVDPEEGLDWLISTDRFQKELSWQPEIALEESITALASTYANSVN